ncbi:uncharacterized protein LOC143282542 [Babylonia areolata]|uniref:uncharacterized protein LOC143282542 n=1 Tax=Babylonia areolata TaxID=304850 RepID=UPI003FD693E8
MLYREAMQNYVGSHTKDMLLSGNNSEWTSEEEERFLSYLSDASFKNRTPVVVYLSLISIVGFVGSTLVLVVYGFRFQPSSTRVFILFMASLDLITNTLGLPLQIATIRYAYNDNYWRCRSFFTFATLSTQASAFVLVPVAMDRFWRICAPLGKQLTPRQAFYVALGTVCSAVVIFVPFLPFYGMHRVNTTEPGIQARMCWSDDEYKHTEYPIAFTIVVGITFSVGLAIMGVSYLSIGITLWRKKVERKRSLKEMRRRDEQNASKAAEPGALPALNEPHNTRASAKLHQEISLSESSGTTGICTGSTSTEASGTKSSELSTLETVPRSDESKGEVLTGEQSPLEAEECSQESEPSRTQCERRQHPAREKKRAAVKSTQMQKGVRRMRSRTTLMMSVLTSCYICNWLPHFVMRAVRNDPVNWCENFTDCGYNIYPIVIRSYYLNSAVNAFVYSFCNERFREECRKLFRGFAKKLHVRNIDYAA